MSNVHGFSSNRPRNNQRRDRDHDDDYDYESTPFLGGYLRTSGDPRKETVWDMLRFSCCPTFKPFSFIAIITFVDIAMYIITLALGGVQTPSMEFLKPQYDTLKMFGNRIPYLMRYEYQVWRFVTPVFLHANFTHICLNVMSQLILGCAIESQIGTLKTIIVYFVSAIGGNLFGALVSSTAAVGASTAIVGLLGVFIALIIINWNRFNPMMKCMLACFALFIIFFNVIFGLSGSDGNGFEQVDNYGHLGGLITGLFAGMALIPPQGGSVGRYEKRVKGIGIAFWVLYFVLGFVLFYTVVSPNPV